jgi:hypothetical protein
MLRRAPPLSTPISDHARQPPSHPVQPACPLLAMRLTDCGATAPSSTDSCGRCPGERSPRAPFAHKEAPYPHAGSRGNARSVKSGRWALRQQNCTIADVSQTVRQSRGEQAIEQSWASRAYSRVPPEHRGLVRRLDAEQRPALEAPCPQIAHHLSLSRGDERIGGRLPRAACPVGDRPRSCRLAPRIVTRASDGQRQCPAGQA